MNPSSTSLVIYNHIETIDIDKQALDRIHDWSVGFDAAASIIYTVPPEILFLELFHRRH